MSKLDELREHVAKLFANATDKSVIEQAAVVSNKIDEIAVEQKQQTDDYSKLLNDYKDVVIHSSFKPLNSSDKGADIPMTSFNETEAFESALKSVMEKK